MKSIISTVLAFCLPFLSNGCSEFDKDNQVWRPGQVGGESGPGVPARPDGFVEEQNDPSENPIVTFDYARLANAPHPRLLCDAEGFESLKSKVLANRATYPTLANFHDQVLSRADKIVSSDRSFTSAGDHYIIVDNLLACAYAYKMTGKSTYLVKVQNDMMKVCGFSNWNPSGLSIGEISFAMAIAYDWLYYDLSLDVRKSARSSMSTKGVKPMYERSYAKSIGNWNSICLGGVACASMAIYEKDKQMAVNQIEKAIKENTIGVTGIYSPDGNYGEGIGYWEYGGMFQVCFLSALKGIFGNTAGIAEIPGFMKSGKYALYMHGVLNSCFSYSDGGSTDDRLMLTSWWFAAQHDDPDLIFCEKRRVGMGDYKYGSMTGEQPLRLLPAILVQLRDFDIDSRPSSPPSEEIWSGQGEMPVTIVRRGWNFDSNDVYLGIKGGLADSWETSATSHAHMDAGSFVFEADGIRWSDDIMRPSYTPWFSALTNAGSRSGDTSQSGLRWDTFRVSNLCHSTIVSYTNNGSVPGKLHPSDYYVDGFASIDEVINTPVRKGAVVNMTAPMKGQVKKAVRTIELTDENVLVVTDEITALDDMECSLEWRMFSKSSSSVTESGVTLTSYGRTRTLSVESSDAEVVPEYRSWPAAKPTDNGWGVLNFQQAISGRTIAGWSATVPAGKTVTFVTALRK